MIITRLVGGLGNQMFQYAAGLKLANKFNADLKLDLSNYCGSQVGRTPRRYELNAFNVSAGTATKSEVANVSSRSLSRKLWRHFHSLIDPDSQWTHLKEDHFPYDERFLQVSGNVYLEGYWQSERYFQDIRGRVLTEFSLNNEPIGACLNLLDEIGSCNSVSIHVRRGDYVNCDKTASFHGVCSIDYYQEAIDNIAQKVERPVFFVFSDDKKWARKNIQADYRMHFITHNDPQNGFEDMRLMNKCQHHIIANSSFSWWGAWLNQNPDKIVIAPHKWFVDGSIDTTDLIPDTWHRM